jgi:hypothetical protein
MFQQRRKKGKGILLYGMQRSIQTSEAYQQYARKTSRASMYCLRSFIQAERKIRQKNYLLSYMPARKLAQVPEKGIAKIQTHREDQKNY